MRLIRHRRESHHHLFRGVFDTSLPRGVRLLALARTVRWVGWGFGEALVPVFIFGFAQSFAEAGLFRSVLEITLLFCLPVVGVLADRVSAKLLIVIGLIIYPFVGVWYLLAGVTGLGIYIVLARFTNAVGWALDSTGIDTYYRRMVPPPLLGRSFGFVDTLAQGGWTIAALIGIFLLPYVPLHYLLFLIAPTSVLALVITSRVPRDAVQGMSVPMRSLIYSYGAMLAEWREWGGGLRLLGTLVFFMGLIEALVGFFLPIGAYLEGAHPGLVVLITVVAALPVVFGYPLGRFVDKTNNFMLVTVGLLLCALILAALALFPFYVVKLGASFLLGVLLELFNIVQKKLVTQLGPATTFGERGGAFSSIGDLGDIAAPLLLGVLLDVIGFGAAALMVAWAAITLSVGFNALRRGRKGAIY